MAEQAAENQKPENALDLGSLMKMVSSLFGGTPCTDCEDKKVKSAKSNN